MRGGASGAGGSAGSGGAVDEGPPSPPPPLLPADPPPPVGAALAAASERHSLLPDGGAGSSSGLTFTHTHSTLGLARGAFDGVEGGGGGGARHHHYEGGGPAAPLSVPASAVSPAIAAKVDRGLLPALCTLTLVNYLDRRVFVSNKGRGWCVGGGGAPVFFFFFFVPGGGPSPLSLPSRPLSPPPPTLLPRFKIKNMPTTTQVKPGVCGPAHAGGDRHHGSAIRVSGVAGEEPETKKEKGLFL
jgi:hypothetical protein